MVMKTFTISTFKILLIAQLIWLFFKERLLFSLWLFIPMITVMLFGGWCGEKVADKINKQTIKELNKLKKEL